MADNKSNRQQLACEYIRKHYVDFRRLRFDTIAQKVQLRDSDSIDDFNSNHTARYLDKWRYITNADINTIVCDCSIETNTSITAKEILTVLNAGSQYIPRVHPLREYVYSVSPYTPDQPDWIDLVASQVRVKASPESDDRPYGADRPKSLTGEADPTASVTSDLTVQRSNSELQRGPRQTTSGVCGVSGERSKADRLWRICFKKWFVAMVASWLKDEVVNHTVLVLVGRQGIFKTTWLEYLIPPHLREYCCKLANANQLSKDDRLRIAEFGLINMDELDAMNARELNAMKSVITATDVNERAAYGYTKERRIRLASFCASSNKREFLTDITGNRRWLPFEVESIQNPFETIFPYDRMYAQARYLIEHDFNYWFELEEIDVLEEHNESFRAQENEEQLLPILFDTPAEGRGIFMTTAQISEHLVSYGNIKKPMSLSSLGTHLGKAGYMPVRRNINGSKLRGWIVYQRDTNEIEALRRILKD